MTTLQIYLPDKQAIAYYREKSTAEFWDKHWSTVDLQTFLREVKDNEIVIPYSSVLNGEPGSGNIFWL